MRDESNKLAMQIYQSVFKKKKKQEDYVIKISKKSGQKSEKGPYNIFHSNSQLTNKGILSWKDKVTSLPHEWKSKRVVANFIHLAVYLLTYSLNCFPKQETG